MARPNPSIPLSVLNRDFAAPLINANQRAENTKLVDSRLASEEQGRELGKQNIQLNQQTLEQNEQAIKQGKLKSVAMDILALPELYRLENPQSAGALGMSIRDRLEEIDSSIPLEQVDRVLYLGANDPQAAAQFIEENVVPQLQRIIPEVFREDIVPNSAVNEQGQVTVQGPGGFRAEDVEGFRAPPPDADGSSGEGFGTPLFSKNEDGTFTAYQLTKGGDLRQLSAGEAGEVQNFLPPNSVLTNDVGTIRETGQARTDVEVDRTQALAEPEAQAAGQRTAATETARQSVERAFNAGAAQNNVNAIVDKSNVLINALDEIKNHPGLEVGTGLSSAIDPRNIVPGTEARDFKALVTQVKDRIFADALQTMRDASKTGGAVGQVSDREGARLENLFGTLDQAQTKEQFLEQLDIIRDTVAGSVQRVQNAFANEYGDIQTTGDPELDAILQAIDLEAGDGAQPSSQ